MTPSTRLHQSPTAAPASQRSRVLASPIEARQLPNHSPDAVGPNAPSTRPVTVERLTVSVVLPVMDETWSLEQTVAILVAENADCLEELLIITSPHTNAASHATIQRLHALHPSLVRVHQQTRPHLGGAIQDGFALSSGRFTVLMATDLETDPHLVRQMIDVVRRGNCDIVVASRWRGHRGFSGYHPFKYCCNFLFQKVFSLLYGVMLTDLTYGFRIYRSDLVRGIIWDELKHPFLFESLVKPLRLGCRVTEISATWTVRKEGVSHNLFPSYGRYFRIGFGVRFRRRQTLVKPAAVMTRGMGQPRSGGQS